MSPFTLHQVPPTVGVAVVLDAGTGPEASTTGLETNRDQT
jgi:hypothetical protein